MSCAKKLLLSVYLIFKSAKRSAINFAIIMLELDDPRISINSFCSLTLSVHRSLVDSHEHSKKKNIVPQILPRLRTRFPNELELDENSFSRKIFLYF